MDAEQFRLYTTHMTQLDDRRRQEKAQHRARQEVKELRKKMIQQTGKCDGSTTGGVRTWIKEIDLAHQRVGDGGITEVVTGTVLGPLRFEIYRQIK